MLGLPRGRVQLVPYTSAWATLFQAERARLQQALGAEALDIQHIGSTAVPGLAAKPILDLGIAVATEAVVRVCIPRLTALGYSYRGYRGPEQGHFFDQGPEGQLTHYLHFRDYLQSHPAACDAYQQLKQELAAQYAADRAAYSAAKASFVQSILAAAQHMSLIGVYWFIRNFRESICANRVTKRLANSSEPLITEVADEPFTGDD